MFDFLWFSSSFDFLIVWFDLDTTPPRPYFDTLKLKVWTRPVLCNTRSFNTKNCCIKFFLCVNLKMEWVGNTKQKPWRGIKQRKVWKSHVCITTAHVHFLKSFNIFFHFFLALVSTVPKCNQDGSTLQPVWCYSGCFDWSNVQPNNCKTR